MAGGSDVVRRSAGDVLINDYGENKTVFDVENGLNFSDLNCTNDYCIKDDDYVSMIENYILTPNEYEWVLIVMHVLVFFVGLIGNALVCLAVYRNHSMRTVTNYFIVNLALADFMVILFCLAPTVIWDVTETWFMGEKLCKIILYVQFHASIYARADRSDGAGGGGTYGKLLLLPDSPEGIWFSSEGKTGLKKFLECYRSQTRCLCFGWNRISPEFPLPYCTVRDKLSTVSVSVSVLTLTFISADRWYAICHPLRFKSTTSRAKKAIIIIWVLSLGFDIPDLIVLETRQNRELRVETIYFMQCTQSWGRDSELTFLIFKILFLYTIPLIFMTITYFQIVRVLWKSDNIPGHQETKKSSTNYPSIINSCSRRTSPMSNANTTTEGPLRSRRKAAKMLVAVVVMFAVCYFPVHLLDILRFTIEIPQNTLTSTIAMISHWLCYANSAVNPIIYNIMSGKFRKEFQQAFGFWCCVVRRSKTRRRGRGNSSVTMQSSAYICRYTSTHQRTEIVPLSAITVTRVGEND